MDTMGSTDAISTSEISKSYGESTVLKNISLAIPKGSRAVLLGPNGAGKSTFLEVIATLRKPDRGEVAIGGLEAEKNLTQVRRQIGLVPQANSLDPQMTPKELLVFQGRALGLQGESARTRAGQLLSMFGLEDQSNKRTVQLSGGTRRKVDLALALVGEPSVIILDEPTTGLDPTSRLAFWDELRRLNEVQGVTLLVATQELHEAEVLATQIIVLRDGVVVANDKPESLKRRVGARTLSVHAHSDEAAAHILTGTGDLFTQQEADRTILRRALAEDEGALAGVLVSLARVAPHIANIALTEPSMDDVFAALARA
jgi:ABC-2 type transport system ATP-binding protein